jgi:hypothetical protein
VKNPRPQANFWPRQQLLYRPAFGYLIQDHSQDPGQPKAFIFHVVFASITFTNKSAQISTFPILTSCGFPG